MTKTSATRCRQPGTDARFLTGLLAAVLMITGTAVADEPPRIKTRPDRARGLGLRLDDQRLAPSVSLQMESLSTFSPSSVGGLGLHDHVMFQEMTDAVRRRTKSVTRKVLRDHLLRTMHLDRGIESVRSSMRGESQTEGRDVDFHFSVHSMLPEVGMRYKLRSGNAMRLSVGAEGDVGFRFSAQRLQRANFSAGFDGKDTFRVRAHFGF